MRRAIRRQAIGGGHRSPVVESHPVDDGAVRYEPEQPGLLVPGLGDRRDRADFDVAEAELAEPDDGLAVFVEAGGDAERGVELEPEGVSSSATGRGG